MTAGDVEVALLPQPGVSGGVWSGASQCVARSESGEVPLGPILERLSALPDPKGIDYQAAYAAMISGDHAGAAARFAVVAFTQGPVAPALYGLALALEELGAHEDAEILAGFVSDLAGFTDPRASALAGYAAYQRRQAKTARVYLAKAARLARIRPEFRTVQRFAQRVLLMQQFTLGD